jgi:hypothetical protein
LPKIGRNRQKLAIITLTSELEALAPHLEGASALVTHGIRFICNEGLSVHHFKSHPHFFLLFCTKIYFQKSNFSFLGGVKFLVTDSVFSSAL